jgi:hypothetical protein
MRNDSTYALCNQQPETIDHLLIACVFSRQVWFTSLRCGLPASGNWVGTLSRAGLVASLSKTGSQGKKELLRLNLRASRLLHLATPE